MIQTLKLVGLGLLLLLCQALAKELFHERIRPDPLLVYALAMGLRAGTVSPLLLAFGFGFTMDVLSGSPLGLFALLRGTACATTRLFDRALYLRATSPWTVYVLVYALVDGTLPGLILGFVVPEAAPSWTSVLLRIPGSAIVTAILAGPVLSIVRRLGADTEGETSWMSAGRRSRL